jgi:predicted PurR-regulated permease PerM
VGGDALVWVPTIVFASTLQLGSTIFQLIRGAGVSASGNLIRPLLICRQAPVSTLALSVGVIGGVSAFGIIGVIIGPVLLTLIAALLRLVDETLLRQPDIPGSCQTTLSHRPGRPRWDRPITVSVQHEPVSFEYSGPSDPLGDTV